MATVVSMPKLGFDMAEGKLVRWVIQEGEPVAKGQVMAEIETDKATVEVEATADGVMARHLAPADEFVPVSTPIAVIAAPGETVDYAALGVGGSGAVEAGPTSITPGPVEGGEIAAAPVAGTEISPGSAKAGEGGKPAGSLPGGVRASPLARRMAAELGIDLTKVRGSGPGGRITRMDVQAFLASPARMAVEAPAPAAPSQPASVGRPGETVPMNKLRAIIGRRMVEAMQQAPHFYVTHEYDVEALLALRQQVNALLPETEKASVNDFIVKAAALALRQFPNLNASLQGEAIQRHGRVNIGVAVAVEDGLLTVVCRDADQKPLRQVAVEVRVMAQRAREGKVRPEDIEGSTFSVSNLGMFEVEAFTAIINPPEAAILAVGSARQVPVVKDGQLTVGARMKATLSVDHRVSDGAEAARFLQELARLLENPLSLLVG